MRWTSLIFTALLAFPLVAQPTITSLEIRTQLGWTGNIQPGKTAQASPCASSPFTVDSRIYTVILKVIPQLSGASPSGIPNIWVDNANQSQFYVMTGDPGITQVKTSRKTYDTAFRNAGAEIVVPDLTWADAADIVTEFQRSPTAVADLKSAVESGASFTLLPVTLAAGKTVDDLVAELVTQNVRLHTEQGWSLVFPVLQAQPLNVASVAAVGSTARLAPANLPITTSFDRAVTDIHSRVSVPVSKTVDGNAKTTAALLLVDSPCLSVSLLPSVSGDQVSGGDLAFKGHYLFPWSEGHSFARIGVTGSSPISGATEFNNLGTTLDIALNYDWKTDNTSAPVRFSAGLTGAYDRAVTETAETTKSSGGLKGSVEFPGFNQLTGSDTRPKLTFEAVGATVTPKGGQSTSEFQASAQLVGRIRWTPIFYSGVDAKWTASDEAAFGGRKNNYNIVVDVLKFVVREPLEFAVIWRCGRTAPDYNRECGFFTGVSLTSNQ